MIETIAVFLRTILWFIIAPAAAHRIAGIISEEWIFLWLRDIIETRMHDSLLDRLIHCRECLTDWTSIIISFLSLDLITGVHWPVVLTIAVSFACSAIGQKLWR